MSRRSRFSFLKPPEFDDPETNRAVRTILTMVLPLLAGALVFAGVAVLSLPYGARSAALALGAGGFLAGGGMLAFKGRPKAAGTVIVVMLWLIATGDLLIGGGVSAPGQNVYFIAILAAGFVISARSAVIVAVLSLAASGCILALETNGLLPTSLIVRDATTNWWAQAITILAMSGLIVIALREIRHSTEVARESERLHRLVAENSNDFIWSQSADQRFTYASPAVGPILGFTPKEMLGKKAVQAFLADGSPNAVELYERATADGSNVMRFEAQHRRKDGSLVWCEINNTLLFDDNGALVGLTGVTRDINDRKLAEGRHDELEEQLRQAQKMEAIGQLAGGIAHDFNNYLTVILGNAEELALDAEAAEAEPIAEIIVAATRSADLTRQLLAFSRKQVLRPVVLDLNRTIRDADRLLKRVLGEDIHIETISASELGRVRADPNQIEQIILNLAVNARAAMPDGGTLTVESGNVYLDSEFAAHHALAAAGRYVMLAISDCGVGMDKETKSRIFEPFFTTRAGGGTGLGLSTVHGIVTQSGGAITVESQPGEGTTFRIYLPRVDDELEDPADHLAPNVEGGRLESATVLVVEDEEMVLRWVTKLLKREGYRVHSATNREEAIEAADANEGSIDLLLTDMVLPGTSGVELARDLKERFDLRTLYMSGFSEDGIVRRGILDPGLPMVQKPFTSRELLIKIREALEE